MIKNNVSFILSFVILIAKMWIFGFSPGVCPTELRNLVSSLGCLVSNGRRALSGDIRLGGSATEELVVGVYVDDLIVTGARMEDINSFKREMAACFRMSDLSVRSYYLGIEVR